MTTFQKLRTGAIALCLCLLAGKATYQCAHIHDRVVYLWETNTTTPKALVPAAKSEVSLSGRWELHMNKAIDTVDLADNDGVLDGTITKDARWGGIYAVTGTRVGTNLTLIYADDNFSLSFTGSMERSNKLSGTFTLTPSPSNERDLWVAFRK